MRWDYGLYILNTDKFSYVRNVLSIDNLSPISYGMRKNIMRYQVK